jgi:hypothetical protein
MQPFSDIVGCDSRVVSGGTNMTEITEVTAPFFEADGTLEDEFPIIIYAWILVGRLALGLMMSGTLSTSCVEVAPESEISCSSSERRSTR